jgi:hypothetical protein
MKNFIRKTAGIRKGTSKKNEGLFSDLSYKAGSYNSLINNDFLSSVTVIGIFIVNK